MKRFVTFDTINGDINLYETEIEAQTELKAALKYYQELAVTDGWPEEIEDALGYGEIKLTSRITRKEQTEKLDDNNNPDEVWFVNLLEPRAIPKVKNE